jgi:hypothetical protein
MDQRQLRAPPLGIEPVRHKPADEVDIAAKPVELGYGHLVLVFHCVSEPGLQLRPSVKSVGAFARSNSMTQKPQKSPG